MLDINQLDQDRVLMIFWLCSGFWNRFRRVFDGCQDYGTQENAREIVRMKFGIILENLKKKILKPLKIPKRSARSNLV